MFERFLKENPAIDMLKKDHAKVKGLFDRFEKEEDRSAKKKIVDEAVNELKVHAELEEQIFYPAVRKQVGGDLMNEADEEHHVAKLIIAELETLTDHNDHYDAKFTVLNESVRHHIKEEENEMMPKARQADIDFDRLAEEMAIRKQELLSKGVPVSAEEKLIAENPTADSPARVAAKKKVHRASSNGRKTTSKRVASRAKK